MACETQSGAIAEPCAAPAQAQTAACGNGLVCSDACRLAVMHF